MRRIALVFGALLLLSSAANAQTNLSVGWRVCEQHGKLIGKPSVATGPAKWVFAQGYGSCEAVQKLVPGMRAEQLDPNKYMSDQMLIERAIRDPKGSPSVMQTTETRP